MKEAEGHLGANPDLPAFQAEQLDGGLSFVELLDDLIENLLRLAIGKLEDIVRGIADPCVAGFPIRRVREAKKLLVYDPALYFFPPAGGEPQAGLEVDVAVDLILFDRHKGVDVLDEFGHFIDGVVDRAPAIVRFKLVDDLEYYRGGVHLFGAGLEHLNPLRLPIFFLIRSE